jgi:hypothetical protein
MKASLLSRYLARPLAVISKTQGPIRPFSASTIKHSDIRENLVDPLPNDRRLKMILKTAERAFKRPEDANLISKLGDLTSFYSLIRIREKMK